jgi:hypothetical protein
MSTVGNERSYDASLVCKASIHRAVVAGADLHDASSPSQLGLPLGHSYGATRASSRDAAPEDRGAHPHHRGAFLDGHLEVATHAHR